MSATRPSLRSSSDCSAAPIIDTGSRSGGTGSQPNLNYSRNMDCSDASSDDGEQLFTPVSDAAQLVEVAFPSGLSDTLEPPSFDGRATGVVASHCSSIDQSSFSSLQESPISSVFLSSSASPASALSSPSFASPLLDHSMLCSTALLETRISLEDSSLDLYPSSIDSSLPCSSRTKSTASDHFLAHQTLATNESHSPLQSSPPRKRPSDTQTPLNSNRFGQKPKLSRGPGSPFLPSTLGSSYSTRFPPNHRLRSDFVRTYALEAELGSGGYGFVMTASHRQEGHEVAVKFIPKDRIPRYGWVTDEYGKRVPKESWFLSRINHPAIVRFYDLFEDDAYFYVVMELHGTPWTQRRKKVPQTLQQSQGNQEVAGDENLPPSSAPHVTREGASKSLKHSKHMKGPLSRPNFPRRASHDLFECIEQSKHKRFSEDDAKYIFVQVVDVIDYLDQLGITHCDIKDENVVIDKKLKIKLIDFGSVVSSDGAQIPPYYKTFYGTAAYASPEIIREQPYQVAPAEIWAIGVLLSFLLTGMSPFPTEDDKRNGRIVLDEAHRARMSDECLQLLRRCLEVDPKRRATIAEVKAHPWLAVGFERLHSERSKPE